MLSYRTFVLACTLALLVALWTREGRAAAFLFDATKAESAGNANWVIDEDGNVAGRLPTPAASGITASTPETYWTGALSSWGVALVQLGHSVEQLPVGGRITYQDDTNPQDLSRYQVYVVCEPNILFTAAEKTALVRYVQEGGSLFVVSDHTGSDRNNDGYDSVAIWNDFFTNNGVQTNPFGVAINAANISLTSPYADTAADNVMTNGVLGPVAQLKYSAGATLTIDPAINPTVRAAFWSGASHTNANVMAAYGSFGAGRFAVLGDSSPPDDGTGSPGHTLYYGWTELGVNHSRLILNASLWLASTGSSGPYNDSFANSLRLGPGVTMAAGANVGATKEPNEPSHADNPGGASVWWQFTPANGGTATLSTADSNFDTLLAVYTGDEVGALTLVASNDNANVATGTSAVTFPIQAGKTYRVAVDGANGGTGRIGLAVTLPPPTNDNFANAAAINYSGTSLTLTGNNYNATKETGEPNHAGYVGGRTVWWRWTASASGAVTFSTLGSDFDTLLAIYTGSSVNALTIVTSNDNYGASLQSLAGFNAVAGTTYRIAVDGYAGAAGSLTLNVSPGNLSNVPANDNFANAEPLTGDLVTATAVTTNATKEAGEPNHGGLVCRRSVWWRWIAPSDGAVTLNTANSNFNTTLGVYTGAAVNTLTTLASANSGTNNQKSRLTMMVAADTAYYIAVDGYGATWGNAVLDLSFLRRDPPANDHFANATVLSGSSASDTVNNFFATTEANEPYTYGGHTVWWRWTAPANLAVTLSLAGSDFTPTTRVYTGSTLTGLNQVTYDASNQFAFEAQSGATYFFRAEATTPENVGKVVLGLTAQPIPTVSITATTPHAYERGAVPGMFTLTFNAPVPAPVPVSISLTGTPRLATDFTTLPAFANNYATVTMPANQQSLTVTIIPIDDGDPAEGDEALFGNILYSPYHRTGIPSQATITIHDNGPYNQPWLSLYFNVAFKGATAAPAADPNGDGVPNLLEFAFNRNPMGANAPATLPTVGNTTFLDPAGASRRYPTLTFLRRKDAANLTYTVERTDDPATGTWVADGLVQVSTSNVGSTNMERVVYRSILPMDGPDAAARQLLRVRVTAKDLP